VNSKQRAQLRSLANSLDTILHIGKSGITENVISQASGALDARELIKCRVLEASLMSAREASDALCIACSAEPVQVIGSRFVLYKESKSIEKEKRIKLLRG